MTIDAIITAGGVPEPGEPLYQYTNGLPKALLPIGNKPLIQWVLDAVNQCEAYRTRCYYWFEGT